MSLPKAFFGLGAQQPDRRVQSRFGVDDAHAAPAAAARGFNHQRESDLARGARQRRRIVRQRPFAARQNRKALFAHKLAPFDFVAHHGDVFGRRADENKAAAFDFFGELGVFRKQPISRMHGLGVGHFGRGDNRGGV